MPDKYSYKPQRLGYSAPLPPKFRPAPQNALELSTITLPCLALPPWRNQDETLQDHRRARLRCRCSSAVLSSGDAQKNGTCCQHGDQYIYTSASVEPMRSIPITAIYAFGGVVFIRALRFGRGRFEPVCHRNYSRIPIFSALGNHLYGFCPNE